MKNVQLCFHNFHPRNKKVLIGLLCLALICVAVWVFTGPLSGNTKVNWKMYGVLVNADGQAQETIEFSMVGKVPKLSETPEVLTLDIALPDDFRYSFVTQNKGYISAGGQYNNLPYYVCETYCYDSQTNSPELSVFALDTEAEYVIMRWADNADTFLVASTDPDTPYAQILEYFQEFAQGFVNFDK